mgnify:CR=1 FL=1
MADYTTADIAELREQTSMGLMDVKKALDEAKGNKIKALELLKERGAEIMEKKAGRDAAQGLIDTYVHGGRIGVVLEVNCETDFVARGDDFKAFVHDLAMQIAAMAPANVEALLEQDAIKGGGTVAEILTSVTGKLGEKIVIKRFERFALGQ